MEPNPLQPFRKKPKPAYMEQEKRYAKKNGMKQTLSSGRFGHMKGDAYDKIFVVDNKQTGAWAYNLDKRDWVAFSKRALMTRRIPMLQIEFRSILTPDAELVNVIVMAQEDFERMRDASGWVEDANSRSQERTGGTKRRSHKATHAAKQPRRS